MEVANRQKARPSALANAVRNLDHASNKTQIRQAILDIEKQYEALMVGKLIGLFGRCNLGAPYEDHLMSVDGGIITHYTTAEAVPYPFSVARNVLRSTRSYDYVEVYSDGELVPLYPTNEPVGTPGVYRFDSRM